jgi:hypothetical protein
MNTPKTEEQTAETETAKKLRELREQRAAVEARRAQRQEAAQGAEALAREERALRDATAIEAAEEEHGPLGRKIAAIDTDLGVVIVKRPNHIAFKRFQDSESATTVEFEKLVRPCLVHPASAEFDRMLEEHPAILTRVANQVVVLAGVRLKEVAGK